ncbi:MAG: ABC transporter ATP-binding protein [Solirubrobacteraceae bacterium]
MSALELERVSKRYTDAGEVVCALEDVTLQVQPGEIAVLYGPSGSGKTTLLLIAGGLLDPDEGVARIAGRDLAGLRRDELLALQRERLGFVYQSPRLMVGVPAVENAAIKLLADGVALRDARPRAADWLERVGLSHRLDHTPERLSGGERQRVAIARALVSSPSVILADEPTANLDSRRAREVLGLLAELGRERDAAVLLATHDPHGARIADRVLALRDGRLLCGQDAREELSALGALVGPAATGL